MSPVQRLRAATAPLHDQVDAAFGGHDLTEAGAYTRFLIAHARALPVAEAALAAWPALPAWRARATLLAEDLADLGAAMPPPLPFAIDGEAAAWGALYVVEGSRLGGVMLARGVPASLPSRYLSARHGPGEWRALLAGFDALGNDEAWFDAALAGATATFALYAAAV